jgi:hypothetical protein
MQVPSHFLPTVYRYNSLNQVATQNTPDGGLSKFWYDRLGRLAISQNAQQSAENNYSYTKYDPFGRIVEVGEKLQPQGMSQEVSRSVVGLSSWLNYMNYVQSLDLSQSYWPIPSLSFSPYNRPGFSGT